MYEYFKLGLDKVAYAPAYTGGGQEQEENSSGMPWGKLAIGGLLGAGAAYGWGKLAPGSAPQMIQNFSSGLDNYLINPLKAKFQGMMSSPEREAQQIQGRANDAGFFGQFKGLKHQSQLHGTEFYEPGALESGANTAAAVTGLGALPSAVVPIARGVLPRAITRPVFHGTGAVGRTLGNGVKFMGRHAGAIGAVGAIPDGLQLGDKLNDTLGIENGIGRAAVKATTTAGSMAAPIVGSQLGRMAGAAAGAKFGRNFGGLGTIAGGIIGGLVPSLVNGSLNSSNNNRLLMNGASARATSLRADFERAMAAKQQGNMNPLKAWYGSQPRKALNMTIDQYKSDPAFQKMIVQNKPYGY